MRKIAIRTCAIKFLVFCVLSPLLLPACTISEERDKLIGSTYEVQTYIGSKPWQKCTLTFEAGGKAYWNENGNNSEWNYDVSETEIMLGHVGRKGRMIHLQMREEGELYGAPCGGLMKKVKK